MTRTAILGWGSLIYDLGYLTEHVREPWRLGGPSFAVEFSRISERRNGALTLVIDEENGSEVPTQFIKSRRNDPYDTACDLRVREDTVIRHIGLLNLESGFVQSRSESITAIVRQWAEQHKFGAVVWTDLPGNFAEKRDGEPFTIPNAINHLHTLQLSSPLGFAEAQRYIGNAPAEIDTGLRQALAQDDWWQSLE